MPIIDLHDAHGPARMPALDRRQRDEIRRLIMIGSMLAEAARQHDGSDDRLADLWETQLVIARPFLAGETAQ